MFAGFPKLGAEVAVASTLDTCVAPVMPGGMVGVVEIESLVEVKIAESVAESEVPRPPTGAQRR